MNSLEELISHPIPRVRNLILTTFFAGLTLLILTSNNTQAAIIEVRIQEAIPHFAPVNVNIHIGDTVKWIWNDDFRHSATSGNGNKGQPDGIFDSGIHRAPYTYSVTFQNVGTFPYYCAEHYRLNNSGTWPTVTVTASTGTPGVLGNISTRLHVGTDNDVLIGGFIVGGSGAKQLLLRGLGPTLTRFGVSGALANPTLELRNSSGALVAFNDDWGQGANAQLIPTNMRPANSVEPAILTTLNPGPYTVILRGLHNTTGVALVETYDMAPTATSYLTNISTRGLVQTDDNVMIAGVIVQTDSKKVIVRALGPTLAGFGIANSLANPTLELHNANGSLLASNDNWKTTQQSEIIASGYAPANDLESAIISTLAPGNYTAVVRGVNSMTGVALVEVYALQ